MKLSLSRIITQQYEKHQAVGVEMTDSNGEIYRQAVLIPNGADLDETAETLDLLMWFLRDAVMIDNPPPGHNRRFVVGEEHLTGHELNREQEADAEPCVDVWEKPKPIAWHDAILVDGVKISGAFLESLVKHGPERTLCFRREGDQVTIEDRTPREGA